jgi:hypothetical protein
VQHASMAALAIAALCGALLYALLAQPPGAHEDKRMSQRTGVGITVAGVLAYCAGYAVFLPLGGVSLTSSSGVNTRLATAAAVGVALLWTGVLTWGVARLSAARPQRTFAVAASVLLATVVSINGVFAECWMEAARRQQRVVAAIRRDVPIFPEGVTLLVDGMCPYVGPAPVFESQYDLAGALQFAYARSDIRADVITSRTVVGDAGVVNEFYGEISTYPYGNLRVYNLDTGTVYPIQNAPAARRYFESVNRQGTVSCPPGIPGKGTRLF